MIEYKNQKALAVGIEGRTVTGIFCVHGHVDDGDGWYSRDRSHPNVFGDFKDRGRQRVVHLWQHQSSEPPTAVINELFEVARADLPPAVLDYAPDATGGTGVKRTYLETPRGNEVLAGLQAGAICEMSYAYEVVRWDMEKQPEESRAVPIRNIYQATLFDTSDVTWGMNPATSADGSKGVPLSIEHQTAHAAVESYIKRLEALHALRVVKEGRRFSGATLAEIEQTIAELQTAAKRLEKLITASETESDDGKSMRRKTQEAYQEWQAIQRRLRALGVST